MSISTNSYVYGHYRKDTNQLFYVGKGCGGRCSSVKGRNRHWTNIVNKHGFYYKIIIANVTDEEARSSEKELILFLRELGANIVNMTDGGDGTPAGFRRTQEHRDKIAAKNKLRTGVLNHNFGKPVSEEQKKKISKALLGRTLSGETRKKMSEFQLKRAAEGNGKARDVALYTFRRLEDDLVVVCTRADLITKFNLKLHTVNHLLSSTRSSADGWVVVNKLNKER